MLSQAALDDPNAPFGVDLALPPVGGSARKTNKDYTHGKLDELIDIIIEFKAKLFISALGGEHPRFSSYGRQVCAQSPH